MKITKPTSAHFRERARHYRLAEAIADAPRDVEMFHDPRDDVRAALGGFCSDGSRPKWGVSLGRCTGSCGRPTRWGAIEGDYAYIVWRAETPDNIYDFGSDTFVIKNGMIVAQTFAGKIIPKQ